LNIIVKTCLMKKLFIIFTLLLLCNSSQAQIITTIAGNGTAGFSGDGGPATAAQLNGPCDITIDKLGNIYFGDRFNSRIRKIDTAGIITTIIGNGTTGLTGDGGPATAARITVGFGLAVDTYSNVYLSNGHRIRKVDTSGIIDNFAGFTIYAGTATIYAGFNGDGGLATAAQLHGPSVLLVDKPGNLYVSDVGNHRIRRIDTANIITTFAGNGSTTSGGDGGSATAASFSSVGGLVMDSIGNLYIGDYREPRIRKVDTAEIITTIVGTGAVGFSGDGGAATAAKLNTPGCLAMDRIGNLYISDTRNNNIRVVSPTGIINTIAGADTAGGFTGDGSSATAALLKFPIGLAFDDIGNLFICDMNNHRIRKVTFNHASAFTTSTSHYYLCPGSGDVPMDSLLGVTDIDTGQVLTWAVQSPAMHGTAVVSYSDTNTGGVQYPTGTTYEGDSTLTLAGIDSFTVSIRDQLTSRIITKKIIIHLLPGGAGSIAGADSLCLGDTNRMAGVTLGGTWGTTSGGAVATVSTTGLVTAVASGYDTVYYAFSNTCVTDTAYHALRVDYPGCTLGIVNETNAPIFTITPNPTNGTFNLQLPTTEPATITIKDLLGKTIHQTTTQQTTNTIYLDNTPAGIYLLTVRTAAGVVCGRLVVE
jgi:hypothetical protein